MKKLLSAFLALSLIFCLSTPCLARSCYKQSDQDSFISEKKGEKVTFIVNNNPEIKPEFNPKVNAEAYSGSTLPKFMFLALKIAAMYFGGKFLINKLKTCGLNLSQIFLKKFDALKTFIKENLNNSEGTLLSEISKKFDSLKTFIVSHFNELISEPADYGSSPENFTDGLSRTFLGQPLILTNAASGTYGVGI